MTQQLVQKHRNAIGQLERSRDSLSAQIASMRRDLIAQREAMAEVQEQIAAKDYRAAAVTIKAALAYRDAQRAPRGVKSGASAATVGQGAQSRCVGQNVGVSRYPKEGVIA